MKQILSIVAVLIICIQMIGCSSQNNNLNEESIKSKEKSEVSFNNKEKSEASFNNDISTVVKNVDYGEFFEGIDGCAIFYNSDAKEYEVYNKELCEKQVSPCSTFKIISALIGLEKGVVTSADSKMNYNGTVYPMESWNKDLNLKEAFQASCVWYFRSVTDKIGQDSMQKELEKLSYGNCDISQWKGGNINSLPELNGFWLESSLKISPKEQVEVLAKIFTGKTDYSNKSIEILKDIMLIDKNEHISIYGKTGSGNKDNGWFVGMIEKGTEKYFFAIHLSDEKNIVSGPKAKEIALKIIRRYYDK